VCPLTAQGVYQLLSIYSRIYSYFCLSWVRPGQGSFHQDPGRGTAGRADPTWPNRTGYSIPGAGFRWGGLGGGNSLAAWERAAAVRERAALFCGLCSAVCAVYSPFLLFLFPLFAVLLNCPYPDPPVSACFFPFSSAPWKGEGWLSGAFVAGRSQTITLNLAPKRGARITAGLSSRC